LAAITPASGDVGPIGGLAIGAAAGLICWVASTSVKSRFGYDDSLDVFGVHGVGGLVGTLMVAFFASTTLGGKEDAETYSMGAQFLVQLKASTIVIVYTLIVSVIILYLVKTICGGSLRASESEEEEGLDLTAHGESGYNN
jgi:Amt family ammonium transporter